ncbi:putative methyltransferase NSUN7 isoform X2 [Melanotaenia boesemani]|uniref:putative methyltransferase NSUN7 isoform X2 n=1 Tax=Melanotaenia boesemani TaxID=1250792 RepID=UPI001C04DD9B|nr:putative methyltransferase NSUN7 isoform X2 [Melanotaenia boesemani]
MVKNKNNRLKSTCKTKKAGFQTTSSKDLTLQEDPADNDTPASPSEPNITSKHQLGFPDRIYLLASVIFQNNYLEKPAAHRLVNYGKDRGLPLPELKDKEMQRSAYELAFSALKYQELLEDIMTDSCFYPTQPTRDDQMRLVAVMLYDFQDRKFLPRHCHRDEEIIQEVRDVESKLLRFKIKLAASLARYRIKHDLSSIECFLPESVKKKQERSISLPLYAWVNTLKSSLDKVQSMLRNAGFSQVESIGQLEGQSFCQDSHCGDMLVFPAQMKAQLSSTELLSDHKLIIQDKSYSLGPNAACSLLPEEGDVLMVGCFSGLTISHMASLITRTNKANNNSVSRVYVCVSDCTDVQKEELQLTVSTMGCKNVQLIQEVFQSLESGDKRLQKVRVILLIPRCSMSAVNNPVEFMLQENGDTCLLQDLSHGSIAQSKLESLVAQQRKDIDHALKFPTVLAIVYLTCSSYSEENVDTVNIALQQVKACSDKEGEPKQANFRLGPSPFISYDHGETKEEAGPFFVLEVSEHSNGCFLAVLNREPEPVIKEAPEEVIARANAKGILERIGSNHLTRKEHHGHTSKMKKAAHVRSSQSHLSARMQSKNLQTKESNSVVSCEHHDFKQSSQGKPKALRLQALKSTVSSSSYSKQESTTSSYSSKIGNSTFTKSITSLFNTTTSTTTAQRAACPPAPVTPIVRPRRAQQKVLKPVLLVLPPVDFPNSLPSQHSRTGFSPSLSYNRWRTPAQIISRGLSKDAMDKCRHMF